MTTLSAEERGKLVEHEMRLLWSENRVDEITTFFAEQIRQAEQAARHQGVEQAREDFNEMIETERKIARTDERRKVIEELAQMADDWYAKEREAGDKYKQMNDADLSEELKFGKELKYHEHYSAAWAAYCLAVEFRALDKDPSEAAK